MEGMGKAADVSLKRLVSMLAEKRDQNYSQVMNTVRCIIGISLLKSEFRCLRDYDLL